MTHRPTMTMARASDLKTTAALKKVPYLRMNWRSFRSKHSLEHRIVMAGIQLLTMFGATASSWRVSNCLLCAER